MHSYFGMSRSEYEDLREEISDNGDAPAVPTTDDTPTPRGPLATCSYCGEQHPTADLGADEEFGVQYCDDCLEDYELALDKYVAVKEIMLGGPLLDIVRAALNAGVAELGRQQRAGK